MEPEPHRPLVGLLASDEDLLAPRPPSLVPVRQRAREKKQGKGMIIQLCGYFVGARSSDTKLVQYCERYLDESCCPK